MAKKRINARNKGKNFEIKIARELREIYDGQAWLDDYDMLSKAQQVAMMKTSNVRRGEQTKGAHEADIVIRNDPYIWLELNCSNDPNPIKKLEQAERDVSYKEEPSKFLPIAVTHKSNTSYNLAHSRGRTLMRLLKLDIPSPIDKAMVTFPYETLLEMLKERKG